MAGVDQSRQTIAEFVRAGFRAEITRLRQAGFIAGIRIVPPRRSVCHAAARAAGCWFIAEVPELPPPDCEERYGCRCGWHVIPVDEAPHLLVWQRP